MVKLKLERQTLVHLLRKGSSICDMITAGIAVSVSLEPTASAWNSFLKMIFFITVSFFFTVWEDRSEERR